MIKPKVALVKGSKKLINAWAFYDWANSVYPLVISSAIFPIYYGMVFSENNQIDFFGYAVKNTAMISFVTALAFIVVALISPIVAPRRADPLSGFAQGSGPIDLRSREPPAHNVARPGCWSSRLPDASD